MTTIINTPRGESDSSAVGLILGVLIAIALIVVFFIYGLPALRRSQNQPNNTNINVSIPTPTTSDSGTGNNTNPTYTP